MLGSKYRSNPKPSFGSQDSLTSTGSESTVEPPPRKRIRQISSDSSDVPDSQTESSQTLDEKGVEEKIAFLTEAFPETNRKVYANVFVIFIFRSLELVQDQLIEFTQSLLLCHVVEQ